MFITADKCGANCITLYSTAGYLNLLYILTISRSLSNSETPAYMHHQDCLPNKSKTHQLSLDTFLNVAQFWLVHRCLLASIQLRKRKTNLIKLFLYCIHKHNKRAFFNCSDAMFRLSMHRSQINNFQTRDMVLSEEPLKAPLLDHFVSTLRAFSSFKGL